MKKSHINFDAVNKITKVSLMPHPKEVLVWFNQFPAEAYFFLTFSHKINMHIYKYANLLYIKKSYFIYLT